MSAGERMVSTLEPIALGPLGPCAGVPGTAEPLPAGAAGRLHQSRLPPGGARAGRPRPGHHRSGQRPRPAARQPQDDGADPDLPRGPAGRGADLRVGARGDARRGPVAGRLRRLVRGHQHGLPGPQGRPRRRRLGHDVRRRPTPSSLVRTVVEAVRIPVTVKMRLGWDDADLERPVLRPRVRAGRRRRRHHPRPHARSGLRRHGQPRRHPGRGRGGRAHPGHRQRRRAHHRRRRRRCCATTGCAGIAIGRGALLNPWIFAQLCRREETGDPGPAATYEQRLDFMDRHFHLLVEHRGERFGCLTLPQGGQLVLPGAAARAATSSSG